MLLVGPSLFVEVLPAIEYSASILSYEAHL
jgi:hypothetical protein